MKKLKRFLRALCEIIVFALFHKGSIAHEAVDDGLIDHSGQGRNSYGR